MLVCSTAITVSVVIHMVNTDTLTEARMGGTHAMTNVKETVIRYVEEPTLTTSTPLALVKYLNNL